MVSVAGNSTFKIQLKEDVKALDEIVVVVMVFRKE